jgi:DNA-binding HxlR family transcriptional regulator
MEYNASMPTSLHKFLESKGGVGLLAVLQNRGKTYSEIEPDLIITSSTISTRLDDATELGLIEIIPARRHGRTLDEYHLTDFGEAVVKELAMRGVISNYRDMRTHYQSMEEKLDEFITWFHDNPGRFVGFSEAHEETLIRRDTSDADSDVSSDEAEPSTEETDNESPTHTVGSPDDVGGAPTGEDSETGSETSTENPSDDAQSKLSDPEIEKKMQEAAENTDADDQNE